MTHQESPVQGFCSVLSVPPSLLSWSTGSCSLHQWLTGAFKGIISGKSITSSHVLYCTFWPRPRRTRGSLPRSQQPVAADYKSGFRSDWACGVCCGCPILFTCLLFLSRNDLYISRTSPPSPLVKHSTVQYAMVQNEFMGSQDALAKNMCFA